MAIASKCTKLEKQSISGPGIKLILSVVFAT